MSRRLPTSPLASVLVLVLLASGFLTLLTMPAAAFGEKPYESNTVIADSFHLNVYSGQSVAQSFLATASYRLLNTTLRLRNTGDTSDVISITIRPDGGGVPSTNVMASSPIVIGNNSLGNYAVPFAAPPALQAGQSYWIVATGSSSILNLYEWHHSNANVFANGQAMTDVGGGWTNPGTPTDMYFVTYGRETDANVTAAIHATRSVAKLGESVPFRVYLNNTGGSPAGTVWLNDTQLPGLTYLSDTAGAAGAMTGWPSFTFPAVGNGPRSFDLVARVDVGTEPGTTLTKALTLAYTNGTGAIKTGPAAQASILVGGQRKQLYLDPTGVGSSERLDAAHPTGGIDSQANETLLRNGSPHDFDLDPVLTRPFRTTQATATLFLDSASHDVQDLVLNLTLADWNGVTLTPLAYAEQLVTTNPYDDYQPFPFTFSALNHTFPSGGRIRFTVRNLGTSEAHAILAMNSTFAASFVDLATTTYVRIDRIDLRDALGPANFWSPKDAIVFQANVSDPFGSSELTGARINVTAPSGTLVVNYTAMALFGTDPAIPSAWKLFRFTLPAPLMEGTYDATITATEANGVQDIGETSALVRAPSFTFAKTSTDSNVQSGDQFTFDVWFNNTGSGPAGRVWINDSLPTELTFQGSSDPGAMTGNYNWTWTSLGFGNYRLSIDVVVKPTLPPISYFRNYAFLNYTDEKGFSWPMKVAFVDVAFRGPVISLTKTSSKTVLHANETIVYQMTMQNTGDPARNLWLNDTLPSGLMYVSDTASIWNGTVLVSGNLLYFEFSNMPDLRTWSFTVTVAAAANLVRGSTLTNVVSLNYTNSNGFLLPSRVTTWTVTVSAPEIASASVAIARNQVTPADVVSASIIFANTGTEAARDVWVNLSLDWGLLFLNATEVALVNGNDVHFTLANVPVGPRTIFLNASVRSNVTDHHLMTVDGTLTYTDGHRNILGTVPISTDGVEASVPRILLLVTPDETTVEAGTRVFLNIYQSNAGSGVAGDVWLTLHLPASFSDARDISNVSGATRTVAGSTYTWHWSQVAPGPKSFPLELTAKASVLNGTRANLTFHTDYTDANGNFVNGETKWAITNFIASRINLVVSPLELAAKAKDTFNLLLTIRNIGGAEARNVWVSYLNESHFEIVGYSPTTGAARMTWGLNWSFTDLSPDQSLTVTVVLRVRDGTPAGSSFFPAFDAVYTNSADLVLGSAQATTKVSVVADPTPLLWIGLAGSGFGLLAVFAVVRRPQIEEVFLVYRDGLLLYHLSRSLSADKDEDVLSGMLTAVQEFVRDAFVYGEHRELHQLDFGDYRIMIERGKNLYLAVVYSGKGASTIRRRVRSILDHIETAYGGVLENWDGDMDKVAGARDLIREYLVKAKGRTFRGLPGLP